MVCGLVLGPYSGKDTGETALFRELLPLLLTGDLVVVLDNAAIHRAKAVSAFVQSPANA